VSPISTAVPFASDTDMLSSRWIRLLFGREFSFQDTLSIWDLLFAEGLRLDLIDLISVAMLLRIRQRCELLHLIMCDSGYQSNSFTVLKADYSSALGLLLRYPSPEPHAPLDFVLDALFLEQNLAPEGAASLVSKYSGYAPGHFHGKSTDSATLRATPRAADYWKDVIESRHRLPDSPSGRSPIRIGQKGLESLLQDVSSGLSRRTEGWAVAQVVRGAVGEAKRNLRNIQSTASSPALIHTERLRSGSPSPVRLSLDTPRELESRIIAAENLNRSLAKLLEDSLTKLRAHETKMKLNLDESAQAEIAGALNKIDDVRNRLQTPLSSVLPTASDNVTSEPKRASPKIPKAAENIGSLTPPSLPSMPKSDDLVSSRREERTAISPPPRQTGSAAARPRSSAPIRPSARTPLADSPLSWMLGDGRAPSGFTACASAPPERNRKAGGDGRPNYLFGDGGRDEVGTVPTAGDDDGVDLDSLRGALGGK
jgi:TBC1 domain family protein 5